MKKGITETAKLYGEQQKKLMTLKQTVLAHNERSAFERRKIISVERATAALVSAG